jgi:putative flippase GtrA
MIDGEREPDFLGRRIEMFSPYLGRYYSKWRTAIAYLFSGGTAALVNLVTLYVLTDLIGWWYLISATFSFLVAFWVSYLLQKYWTFRDKTEDTGHRQKSLYFLVALINLAINTVLMYFFVDIVHIWGEHMVAQILTSALIAIESFFVYKIFIFKK